MEPFNIEAFAEELTLMVVKSLKKAELIQVAQYYKLEVNSILRKSELSDGIFSGRRDSFRSYHPQPVIVIQ